MARPNVRQPSTQRYPTLGGWCADWQHAIPPNGENLAMLHARVAEWLSETTLSEKPVLIAHAGVVRTLRVIAVLWEEAMSTPVRHLTWENWSPQCLTVIFF